MTDQTGRRSHELTASTIAFYDQNASWFWDGTRDHDVTQNYAALLDSISAEPPFRILDFGCGPGRDLRYFRELGHQPVGLDGSPRFAEMARRYSEAEVWVQDFLELDLPAEYFDGVFANAALFHLPKDRIGTATAALLATLKPSGVLFCSNPRGNDEQGFAGGRFGVYYRDETWLEIVKRAANAALFHLPKDRIGTATAALLATLKPSGVLFCSNPRGNDEQGFAGGRFGVYYRDETWLEIVKNAGFEEIRHYHRPAGKPLDQQPWFATVWRKPANAV